MRLLIIPASSGGVIAFKVSVFPIGRFGLGQAENVASFVPHRAEDSGHPAFVFQARAAVFKLNKLPAA